QRRLPPSPQRGSGDRIGAVFLQPAQRAAPARALPRFRRQPVRAGLRGTGQGRVLPHRAGADDAGGAAVGVPAVPERAPACARRPREPRGPAHDPGRHRRPPGADHRDRQPHLQPPETGRGALFRAPPPYRTARSATSARAGRALADRAVRVLRSAVAVAALALVALVVRSLLLFSRFGLLVAAAACFLLRVRLLRSHGVALGWVV